MSKLTGMPIPIVLNAQAAHLGPGMRIGQQAQVVIKGIREPRLLTEVFGL